jgi:uncharacterized membrane protein YhhN
MDLRWSSVPRPARGVLALYGALSVANIVLSDANVRVGDWITKPLLMPTLAVFVVLTARALGATGLRAPLVGILFGGAGDAALIGHGTWFQVGMGCFAVGHIGYLVSAFQRGARRRRDVRFVAAYAVVWIGLVLATWNGLGALRIPVVIYGALLMTMAMFTSTLGRWTAIGAALFVVSDGTLALDIAKVSAIPHLWFVIMPTYVLAQLFLAFRWSGLAVTAVTAAPATEPTPAPSIGSAVAAAETSG